MAHTVALIELDWIVNPEDETVTVLRLEGDGYTEQGVFRHGDTAISALLAGFTLSVSDVLMLLK